MNIAAKVAADKRKHPDDFCSVKGCLWRIHTSRGVNPCRNHPSGAERITVPCGEGRSDTTGGQDDSVACPTVRSLAAEREERLQDHDPERCTHPNCRLAF